MPQGRDRARPQGPGRARGHRSGRLREDRRAGEERARELTSQLQRRFLHQAEQCEQNGSPLYADVCRRLADEPVVAEVVRDDRWDRPLQLLGALHYLALSTGIDPWPDPASTVASHKDWLRAHIAAHGVQTNEVQRSWMLLPCFLETARRAGVEVLDLIELGPSAGLNLVWDRYRYRYEHGAWGPSDASLELAGEERQPVPAEVLRIAPRVRSRRGIDLSPFDVTRDDHALLLKSFVWADQTARLERLDRAVQTLRRDPPRLEQGDVLERLPELLAERQPGALTVVYETAVLGYVGEDARRIVDALADAGTRFPLAFVWTGEPRPNEHGYYGLRIRFFPEGDEVLLAHAGFHGQWLEWLGDLE